MPRKTIFNNEYFNKFLKFQVPNEESLKKVAAKLQENSIAHKLWIEQPENIPTCLAIKPYPKDQVKKFVGKFKLYKAMLESNKEQ